MINFYKTAMGLIIFALIIFSPDVDSLNKTRTNYQVKNIGALNAAAVEIGRKETTQYPCKISGTDGLLLIGRGQPYITELF